MGKKQLAIDLVPLNNWGQNVRTQCPDKVWDRLRRITYRNAKHRCEICGETGLDQGRTHPVECHEIWVIDEEKKIQRLDGLIALCPLCHEVIHAGRTVKVKGPEGLAAILDRLCRVNGWTLKQSGDHFREAFATWQKRSQHRYELDISWALPATPGSSTPVYE